MFKIFKIIFSFFFIKNLKSITINIVLIFAIHFLYSDIVEYMNINNFKPQIIYILLGKWFIYLISSYLIYKNINDIYKQFPSIKLRQKKSINPEIKKTTDELFEEIKDKPILKSSKDIIYEKLEKEKNDRKN